MKNLPALLLQLESKMPYMDKTVPAISASSVGGHIEHVLKVFNQVIEAIKTSTPSGYKRKFNFLRIIILITGVIPRGRVKAPTSVAFSSSVTAATLRHAFDTAKENLDALNNLERNYYFEHPSFGHLNLKPARRFLAVHTNHHLKIIDDIIRGK